MPLLETIGGTDETAMGSVQVLIDLDVLVSYSSRCGLFVADYVGPLGWISVVAVVV